MVLKCPSCWQTFTVPDDVTTGKAKCPHCGQRLDLGRMLRPGDLRPGTVLGGCRIDGLLGRGGMAVVYKATQVSLDRPVALKVLPTRFASNREFVERFNREASALALLSHPNIVSILDKGVEDDTYYFVMEYVEGKSLRDRLLREERLSPQETRQLMRGICAGLAYAHENGIVHRDLKPGNILLDASGKPKLADFGIARLTGAETHDALQLTAAHTVMGSADYMAPEQRADAAKVDCRADIYSLGVMLYQMLTGNLPVGSFKPVAHVVRGIPTAVDRVIRTALAASPDERFESVNKFLNALERAFEETGVRHPARAAAQAHHQGITPASAVLIALAVLIVLAGLLAIVISGGPSPDQHTDKQQHTSKVPRPKPPPVTKHVVPPKPPDPKTSTPPDSEDEEPPAVRTALADARQYIAANPDNYPGQTQRLRDILENSQNPQVLAAVRKEMAAVNERLNKAIADHFAATRKRADALMDQRAYTAAVQLAGALPPHLFTSEAKKQAEALSQEYRGKCWTAYDNDRKRAIALAEEGRLQEAIAALTADYPSVEIQRMASEEILKLKNALAAKRKLAREEQVRLRAELATQLKSLWAQRRYAEALAAANDALAKAPDEACRDALAPHVRAATLLDTFWKAVIDALAARKGQTFTIAGSKYLVKDVDGDNLILALGPATTSRRISAFSAEELHNIARDWLDPAKKADDNLALALFLTYDAKPDTAAAARAFDKALSLGAQPKLVAAMRDITAASPAPEPPEAEPKAKETEPVAGHALDLNGASSFVEVPDDPRNKRSLRPKSFTIEAWVWRRQGPGDAIPSCIVAKNAGITNAPSFALYVQDGCWAYSTGDGAEVDSVVTRIPCALGDWTHGALTYDDAGFRTLFVDGKQVHRSRARRPIAYDNEPLYVGALRLDGNPAHFWAGGIDEVRLTNGLRYSREFVPERLAKTDDQTLLFLRFDEGKGPRVKDNSLYDNNGRLRGGAAFLPPADFKLRRPSPPLKALPPTKQPTPEDLPSRDPAP